MLGSGRGTGKLLLDPALLGIIEGLEELSAFAAPRDPSMRITCYEVMISPYSTVRDDALAVRVPLAKEFNNSYSHFSFKVTSNLPRCS